MSVCLGCFVRVSWVPRCVSPFILLNCVQLIGSLLFFCVLLPLLGYVLIYFLFFMFWIFVFFNYCFFDFVMYWCISNGFCFVSVLFLELLFVILK